MNPGRTGARLVAAALALPVVAAPSAAVAGSPAGARADRVTVGDWARPLHIRVDPGAPGVPPGRIIGSIMPPAEASALCHITDGSQMTAWGRTRSDWVKIRYGWEGHAWLWGGGLNPYSLREC
ncbi:hypothetical protein GWI34_29185 [Actinomadura sp. DSM 109109]|nr:hypothetical protein [Actinomadura lepetitiana]